MTAALCVTPFYDIESGSVGCPSAEVARSGPDVLVALVEPGTLETFPKSWQVVVTLAGLGRQSACALVQSDRRHDADDMALQIMMAMAYG